jgi:hypothetical protein
MFPMPGLTNCTTGIIRIAEQVHFKSAAHFCILILAILACKETAAQCKAIN